ncbi:MAG: 2-dehydropantoate 2-reductase [Deltaproteobacteria bacterium]|nr:MAG: 2-dehydropantoate 2-reductase [Deltaproteobacteria bacterium]
MMEENKFDPKTFAIIGAGPVGSIVAACLANAGYRVILCDVVTELIEPALETGITIEGAENIVAKVSAICQSVDDLSRYSPDVIFVTVKANALPLIASAIEGFHRPGMYVVSWQNGIDTELVLAHSLGKRAVMRAVVNYGCDLRAPAHVHMSFHHHPHFIQELDKASRAEAEIIANCLTNSGLPTQRTDQIISMVWRKAILNACMNPVCAVTGYTMAQAMNDPIVFQLVDSLIKECVKVARANEISLGWDFYPYSIDYMKNAGDHKPSMLVDIEKKRPTEIDFINGKFVEYGLRAGIDTPYNKTLRALVKALESKL